MKKIKGFHLTQEQFDSFPEYSATIPTGVYAGKYWKAQTISGWVIRGFEEEPDQVKFPNSVKNAQYLPLIGEVPAKLYRWWKGEYPPGCPYA